MFSRATAVGVSLKGGSSQSLGGGDSGKAHQSDQGTPRSAGGGEERSENLPYMRMQAASVLEERGSRRILDGRYKLLKTIGHGRFAKVKKAIELSSGREVAVKVLKLSYQEDHTPDSRKDMIESFFQEVSILSFCDHPNIVRLLHASFNGTLIKEELQSESLQQMQLRKPSVEQTALTSQFSPEDEESDNRIDTSSSSCQQTNLGYRQTQGCGEDGGMIIVKRKTNICYYVMKLASYGELFKVVQGTERFTENLSRSLFAQLIEGLEYLHNMGVMHRDIKPENLLLSNRGKLIIGDFGFAKETLPSPHVSSMNQFVIERPQTVGSYEYNAPELFQENTDQQQSQYQSAEHSCSSDEFYYDGAKADVFSAGVTLFLMLMKSPPFRGAHLKDPFFRRLSAPDKKAFWKIFSSLELSDSARDLFERMVDRDPKTRFNIADVLDHAWLKSGEILPESELIKEFGFRDEVLQKLAAEEQAMKTGNHHQEGGAGSSESSDEQNLSEEECRRRILEIEELERLRHQLIEKVDEIVQRLRVSRNVRQLRMETQLRVGRREEGKSSSSEEKKRNSSAESHSSAIDQTDQKRSVGLSDQQCCGDRDFSSQKQSE